VYVDALVLRDRDADGNGSLEERLYVQQDANFNVTAVIDSAGVVQERYVGDPYGAPTVLAPDWTSRVNSLFAWNYLHQGGRYDSSSGLYHFRNRDYSPSLGRWVQTDPWGLGAGDPNLYRALGNNPINQ
jgi:RHS repeat-associated protein